MRDMTLEEYIFFDKNASTPAGLELIDKYAKECWEESVVPNIEI
jgi:hypothetical protein